MIDWFSNPAHWTGNDGVFALIVQHLVYSSIALFFACLIGLPVGLYVGHTGRGVFLIAGLANALRALPSLGLIVLLVILFGPVFSSDMAFILPSIVVLVLLAVPPIMNGTYAGVAAVDPAAVDAARGMGKRPLDILFDVELPCALPLIFSGLRSATLQIISTATIAGPLDHRWAGAKRLLSDGSGRRACWRSGAGRRPDDRHHLEADDLTRTDAPPLCATCPKDRRIFTQ